MPEHNREHLEGWIPAVACPDELRAALDRAFDYRGDVTVTLKDGRIIEGYIFDRRCAAPELAQCTVRILPIDGGQKLSVCYADIACLQFSGRDPAAGRSFQTWIEKYRQKKSAGEKNIRLEPEKLE